MSFVSGLSSIFNPIIIGINLHLFYHHFVCFIKTIILSLMCEMMQMLMQSAAASSRWKNFHVNADNMTVGFNVD